MLGMKKAMFSALVVIGIVSTSAIAREGSRAGEDRLDNGLEMRLIWCPPGQFQMGVSNAKTGEKPASSVAVELTTGFWLAQHEVTQGAWEQVMGTQPWKDDSRVKTGPDFPATYVSYRDAVEFCQRLTASERAAGRLASDEQYSLPTEAQWEYACRAGVQSAYCFGDDESMLTDFAWFSANAFAIGERYAHAVGQKRANPWGVHDMHGNVFEWCLDDYATVLPGGRDPIHTGGAERVIRGGGWFLSAKDCRSDSRRRANRQLRNDVVGFRVAIISVNESDRTQLTGRPGTRAGEERSDNSIQLRLLWCPPGEFTMGSPNSEEGRYDGYDEGQVKAKITDGFWLGKFEVTQGEWENVMGTQPWKGKELTRTDPRNAVSLVTYEEAIAFCEALTDRERAAGRLGAREAYTLPTEPQWEYACRAGTDTAFSFGDDRLQLGDYAWYVANAGNEGETYAHPVGQKRANPWGFHDVHGNVLEWCRDSQWDQWRMVRGGSWDFTEREARSACRWPKAATPNTNVGFRVALIQEP